MAGHTTAADPTQRPTMPNPDPANHLAAMYLDHLNKSFAQQRSAAARGNFQDDSLYGRPFPGSSQNIKINNIGWPAVGLVAILLALCACMAFWIWSERAKFMPETPPAAVAPVEPKPIDPVAPPPAPAQYETLDFEIRWWVEGQETQVHVEEIKR